MLPFTKGVGGHTLRPPINYGQAVEKGLFHLTFLRDPVSRFVSHLNYLGIHLYKDKNFNKYFDRPKYENFMTKRLAGKEDVKLAKRILIEHFDFVGITEMFDESLLLLASKLGATNFSPNYERKNVLKTNTNYRHKNKIDDNMLKKIREKNLLDIELYEFAVQNIFNEYILDYGPGFSDDVQKFQRKNEDYRYAFLRSNLAFFYRVFYHFTFERLIHFKFNRAR
jgi:hypothetical protein